MTRNVVQHNIVTSINIYEQVYDVTIIHWTTDKLECLCQFLSFNHAWISFSNYVTYAAAVSAVECAQSQASAFAFSSSLRLCEFYQTPSAIRDVSLDLLLVDDPIWITYYEERKNLLFILKNINTTVLQNVNFQLMATLFRQYRLLWKLRTSARPEAHLL